MFCPNCGKQIKEGDNFCRYCGNNLQSEDTISLNDLSKKDDINLSQEPFYKGEELVLYEVKKHFISMFWPIFLTPLFIIYFWTIFLNTHSFFSWVVVFAILTLIIYPIARFKSDRIVITTKCAHIKIGIVNPAELEIPLEKFDTMEVSQSSIGRMLDYGTVSFCVDGENFDYPYIQSPEELQYIIDNPQRFVKDSLEEE